MKLVTLIKKFKFQPINDTLFLQLLLLSIYYVSGTVNKHQWHTTHKTLKFPTFLELMVLSIFYFTQSIHPQKSVLRLCILLLSWMKVSERFIMFKELAKGQGIPTCLSYRTFTIGTIIKLFPASKHFFPVNLRWPKSCKSHSWAGPCLILSFKPPYPPPLTHIGSICLLSVTPICHSSSYLLFSYIWSVYWEQPSSWSFGDCLLLSHYLGPSSTLSPQMWPWPP